MSDPLMGWLGEWGGWLDDLLATGLACPTHLVRQRIERWCLDAELLGFASQQQAAQRLLQGRLTMPERTQVLFALLLEQDMLLRLYEARRLKAQVEGDTI